MASAVPVSDDVSMSDIEEETPATTAAAAAGSVSGPAPTPAPTPAPAPAAASTPGGKLTPLYGGALKAVVPEGFMDISDMRVVPDHQEVFVNNDTDCSLIVELNSRTDDVDDAGIARYLFEDLGEANGCSAGDMQVDFEQELPDDALPNFSGSKYPKRALVGIQRVSKYNESKKNVVRIFMAVLRLPSVETDVTLMMNVPSFVDADSASGKTLVELADSDSMAAAFQHTLHTLSIEDWSLFG